MYRLWMCRRGRANDHARSTSVSSTASDPDVTDLDADHRLSARGATDEHN